ncbi:roadblock/LC7 domain-containing protein [Streptomyces sp. OspMP-M43]|uniref:roadblock/LC7 domain-containing protein n=1 Tax=Streptomyces sp. OspMP-M43 TaxID=1839781 RepID=UPI00081B51F9|nr:roadblock/LC7 domain-containing protein [Streptomyces sp. OspMP-M43]SCD37904.1 Predicted regulator of Ras-like GTPase activity, Roadblock/LC7/MglB family [Streptomyces sp. OspMP-M43]
MTAFTTQDPQQISWMIADLQKLQGVRSALVVASDGMLITHSDGIGRDMAERLAASVSGMVALGMAARECFDHLALSQIAYEFEGAMLLVTSVGQARNALIAALTEPGADVGVVGDALVSLAPSIAAQLDVADRSVR